MNSTGAQGAGGQEERSVREHPGPSSLPPSSSPPSTCEHHHPKQLRRFSRKSTEILLKMHPQAFTMVPLAREQVFLASIWLIRLSLSLFHTCAFCIQLIQFPE